MPTYSLDLLQAQVLHTQRTASLEVQLVDSRGYGGVASMDPAGSAVLDHIFAADAIAMS